jgi:hypothetical protein
VTTLDELRERVRATLDVLELVVHEVIAPEVPEGATSEHQKTIMKIVGEAAMLLRMAHRALPDTTSRRRIVKLAEQLGPYARSAHVQRALLRRPSRAPMRVLAHACLTSLGVCDDGFDQLARLALSSSVANANERVPYRMLDAAWARHMLLGDEELNHPALPLSPIGAGVDLLAATVEDAYAFSHALPYATDFGRLPLPPGFDTARLSATSDALCVKALDEDDLDLLGELLMAPALLREPWTPIQAFSWNVLATAWDRFGFVPGPGLPAEVDGEDRGATVRRVLGTAYHTIFVSGLFVATIASVGTLPPSEIPAGPRTSANGIRCNGTACRAVWDGMSAAGRGHLGELVLALELRQAFRENDLSAMRNAVSSALVCGAIGNPLFEQAVEFLERVLVL